MKQVERLFLLVAVLALGAWAGATLEEHAFQRDAERRLDAMLDRPRENVAWAARTEARASGLVGRIEIPRLRMKAIVADGIATRTLGRAVGHVRSTAYPGEPGNVGLAGHRDTFFRRLERIRRGDVVRMTTPDGTFRYEVDRIQVVDPGRGELLGPTPTPHLTLVTCYPFRMIGPAPRRFVVTARQVDPPPLARAS